MTIQDYAESKAIVLHPEQLAFVQWLVDSVVDMEEATVFMSATGVGTTTALQLVESYFKSGAFRK